jgi:O-antigen/teichoic acid export membrane protein
MNLLEVRRRLPGSWLRSSGIAGDTEAQRSSERNRRAIASAVAGLALRGSSFVVVLVSVPLTLSLLGPIRFGLWMTLASVVALLGATDLGIGNGVLNNVARAFGQGDVPSARRYMASGLVALAGIALAAGAVFLLVYPIIPWARLYNVASDSVASAEAGPATAAFVLTYLIGLPLGLGGYVRSAYQEGFVQSAFVGLGNMLTLALLVLATAARASLPILVLAITIGPLVAAVANLVVLLRFQRPWLTPRWSDVTVAATRSVIGVGFAFMALQVAYVVGFQADPLVVAQVIGPVAVGDYSVVSRLFSVPAGLAAIATLPLWPAYREAISRSDIAWVRVTLKRSLLVVLAATVPLAVALTIVGPAVVGAWTQGGLAPAYGLYPALGALTVTFAIANAFGMLFNGAQAMRFHVTTMILMAALNITASIYLASKIGVAGVALGSVLAVVAVLIVPAMVYIPRLLHQLEHGSAQAADLLASDGFHEQPVGGVPSTADLDDGPPQ